MMDHKIRPYHEWPIYMRNAFDDPKISEALRTLLDADLNSEDVAEMFFWFDALEADDFA